MQKTWIAVQVPAGRDGSSTSEPERSLGRARELARADAVILQPAADLGLTARQVSAARKVGLEVLLWFPVLADNPGDRAPGSAPTRNADGSFGHGKSGAWQGLVGGEESFLFRCPNDAGNLAAVRGTLQSLLDSLDVDGVMLDKIRFPSPSNGLEALFCCFCESCRASFEQATGLSMDEVSRKCVALLGLLRSRGSSALASGWTDPGSFWKAAGVPELAAFRARSVTAAARELALLVRSRSLSVGLDLFSPSLAPLVGQDYEVLSGLCDWLKPMTYRAAVGPAGLPLEIASLWKALQEIDARGNGESARALLERVYPWGLPARECDLLKYGFSASVISSELLSLRRLRLAPGTKVHAGVEAVQMPQFGIHITTSDLEASLQAAGSLADGIVVSWDLRHIPEENLRLIGSVMQ